MSPGIFLIQDNEELIEMNEETYESEKLLQAWLVKYPELLVGNQIDAEEPRRFLLIEQECGIPSKEGAADRWKIDHIYLDQQSVPTMIEVKRSTDTLNLVSSFRFVRSGSFARERQFRRVPTSFSKQELA